LGYKTFADLTPELKDQINKVSYYDPSKHVDSDEEEEENKGDAAT